MDTNASGLQHSCQRNHVANKCAYVRLYNVLESVCVCGGVNLTVQHLRFLVLWARKGAMKIGTILGKTWSSKIIKLLRASKQSRTM